MSEATVLADTTATQEPSGFRSPHLVGRFRVEPSTGRWAWSDEIYHLHGFEPHEVVPTTDLVLAHTHPDDREGFRDLLGSASRSGAAFSSVHRVVTAKRRELTVTVVGCARPAAAAARSTEMTGYFVDLTTAVAERARERAMADIRAAAASRGAIEQAKGVIAVLFDVEADHAFEMMRKASNDHNVPVRELAQQVVDVVHRREIDRRAAIDLLLGVRRPSGR
ncbi:PAS and ANTAR domain-containing protein [Isoptericola cucumis]|uniref:PAS and ANTAR domain-containing protein n=1 Tax=Isoptericola cucumis TaxID=1776856 RepID=UPI00320A47D2